MTLLLPLLASRNTTKHPSYDFRTILVEQNPSLSFCGGPEKKKRRGAAGEAPLTTTVGDSSHLLLVSSFLGQPKHRWCFLLQPLPIHPISPTQLHAKGVLVDEDAPFFCTFGPPPNDHLDCFRRSSFPDQMKTPLSFVPLVILAKQAPRLYSSTKKRNHCGVNMTNQPLL